MSLHPLYNADTLSIVGLVIFLYPLYNADTQSIVGLVISLYPLYSTNFLIGNICRSPIAEGVFAKTVSDMGLSEKWEIDSAALGSWHVGNDPDYRALDTMRKHGVPYSNQARQITKKDFDYYDYIFGMDEENMRELKRKAPAGTKAKLLLLGDFDPKGDRIIRDPYYDNGSEGFEKCYQQSVRCSKAFLDQL